MKKFFVMIVLLMAGFTSFGQTFQENILYGDEAMADRDFLGAADYYRNALYLDSTSTRAAWKYAEACRQFNNYREAEKYYGRVVRSDQGNKYPLGRFWLGMMQKATGDYESAGENFAIFIQSQSSADEYYLKKANVEIEACKIAPGLLNKPLNLTISRLFDAKVNTPWAEFNASQMSDTALLFSALRPVVADDAESFIPNAYVTKLYQGTATQAGWSRVKPLDSRFNVAGYHNANACLSADQTKMYFTRGKVENNPDFRTDLYFAECVNGKWQKPVKLPAPINMDLYTSTQPTLSEGQDYDVLYFVSDRPGGFGKNDLWYVVIKDGKYGEPINLGSNINTPGDEITPFYHDSTATLYFSSDYLPGLGGYDIFKSKGALNQWTTPENIGYPLNTGYNDIYFCINRVDNDGYFTSNRPGSLYISSETCCNDIYYYEWKPEVKTNVVEVVPETHDTITLEESIKLLLPLTLYFHNDEPDPRTLNTSTKKNYQTTLSEYYDMKDTYKEEYSKGLTGFEKLKAERDIDDFFENYVGRGFAQLKLFSKLLLQDLEQGSKVKLMIKGYCSPLNNTEYNVNLAKRRISSLKNYLFEYDEGVFRPYLDSTAANGGVLRILEDPIGESTASPFVSDNPNDKRNSIYSRSAAFERKIQIVLYESEQGKVNTGPPVLSVESDSHDFGTLVQGEKAVYNLKITNTGGSDLLLSGIETSCGCTTIDWSKEAVKPGDSIEISVFMRTDEDLGQKNESVTILSNATNAKITINLSANIIEKKQE
jgi:hypothetical protein